MTEKQKKQAVIDARETIEELKRLDDKDSFILYGASLAVLNYEKENADNICEHKENETQAKIGGNDDILPESDINEHIQDMNISMVNFWKSIDQFENMRTQENKDIMISNLKKLLEIFEYIISELRLKAQWEECVKMLKQFYLDLKNKI